jgi:hypothetical protein
MDRSDFSPVVFDLLSGTNRSDLSPCSFQQGGGSVFIWYGSGSSILGWIPIRIRGFWWPKREKFYIWKFFLLSKTNIYLSLGLHKGRLRYKRSLQLSKENIQHFRHEISYFFSTFVGHFCPPGSGSGFRIRILIRIHWPDWIRIQFRSRSGSTSATATLVSAQLKSTYCIMRIQRRGLQGDVVNDLSWPIAPSYMSPNAGGGEEGLRGLRQWEQLCAWSLNKLWRSISIFNLWFSGTKADSVDVPCVGS